MCRLAVTLWVSLMEQKLSTFRGIWVHLLVYSEVCVAQSLDFCIIFFFLLSFLTLTLTPTLILSTVNKFILTVLAVLQKYNGCQINRKYLPETVLLPPVKNGQKWLHVIRKSTCIVSAIWFYQLFKKVSRNNINHWGGGMEMRRTTNR